MTHGDDVAFLLNLFDREVKNKNFINQSVLVCKSWLNIAVM